MLKFVIKRILSAVPVLLIVISLVFFMMRIIPGDPARLILGDEAKQEDVDALRERMGLNDPLGIQFLNYLKDIVKGDWGDSLQNHKPVFKNIRDHLEPTILLTLYAKKNTSANVITFMLLWLIPSVVITWGVNR